MDFTSWGKSCSLSKELNLLIPVGNVALNKQGPKRMTISTRTVPLEKEVAYPFNSAESLVPSPELTSAITTETLPFRQLTILESCGIK